MPAAERRMVAARPYPGLRSFEATEAMLFHGRARHTEELLRRLSQNRFLAVLGGSGSGKSSLVRAGLLPALYRGYLVGATSRWRVAIMRPGSAPLAELAKALAEPNALGSADETAIRESSYGLINAVRAASLARGESLLLVVDQFEELFRFRNAGVDGRGGSEAALFASQLLCAADEFGAPVYVAITMRSDFLGECAQFQGLPEALNKGQYLIPRMSREQRREAITEPLDLFDASISDRLVQQLLNDAGDDPDQLPVLQHALQQTFAIWKLAGKGEIDIKHYKEAGTMQNALHEHAERVLKLTGDSQWIAERIFRCLTVDDSGRAIRRPAPFERILRVIGVVGDPRLEPEATRIVQLFAAPENSFLLWGTRTTALEPDSVVDISHESLMRKWATLQAWVSEEAKAADIYRYLRRDASLYPNAAGLWSDPDLSVALKVKATMGWNDAWADQYSESPGAGYSNVEKFLDASVKDRERKRRREKMLTWLKLGVAALVVIVVFGSVWLVRSRRENAKVSSELDVQTKINMDLQAERSDLHARIDNVNREISILENRTDPVSVAQLAVLQNEKLAAERKVQERDALLKDNANQVSRTSQDYSESLKRINELQAQLKQAWDERDRARADRTDAAVKSPEDPAAIRRQFEALQSEYSKVLSENIKLTQSRPPTPAAAFSGSFYPLVVPQYSWQVYPKENPRFGIILGDLGLYDTSTTRMYFFALPSNLSPPQAVVNKKDIVNAKIAELNRSTLCPTAPDAGLPLQCFLVSKQKTDTETQMLGTVNVGSAAFAVHAMGWVMDAATINTDVLSLAMVPVGAALSRANTVTSAVSVGTLKWNPDQKDRRFASLGATVPEWEGSFLNLAELASSQALTLIAFSTTNRTLIDQVKISGDRRIIEQALKPSGGPQLAPETFHVCTIRENETCWITLPSGQLVGVTAKDLAFVRGRVELELRRG